MEPKEWTFTTAGEKEEEDKVDEPGAGASEDSGAVLSGVLVMGIIMAVMMVAIVVLLVLLLSKGREPSTRGKSYVAKAGKSEEDADSQVKEY
jgi:hypothetical protein